MCKKFAQSTPKIEKYISRNNINIYHKMKQKTLSNAQRKIRLQETINYAITNNFNKQLINSYQEQLNKLINELIRLRERRLNAIGILIE